MSRTVLARPKIDSIKPSLKIMDEVELVAAIAKGDEQSFGEVYQRYYRQIYNYLFSILNDSTGADDVLQEVFLAVWQGARRFEYKSSLKTWIFRIAYKKAISWLRQHGKSINSIELDETTDSGKNTEDAAITTIQNRLVQNALMKLAPKHRIVLELAFLQDLSYSEIAKIMACPVGTVKSRMSYALRNLNQILLDMDISHRE